MGRLGIRWMFLGALLAGGLGVRASPSRAKVDKAPKVDWRSYRAPAVTHMPTSCAGQCALIQKMCADPCRVLKNRSAGAKCVARCQKFEKACSGSCEKYGRIDKKYLIHHLHLPKHAKKEADATGSSESVESEEATP